MGFGYALMNPAFVSATVGGTPAVHRVTCLLRPRTACLTEPLFRELLNAGHEEHEAKEAEAEIGCRSVALCEQIAALDCEATALPVAANIAVGFQLAIGQVSTGDAVCAGS